MTFCTRQNHGGSKKKKRKSLIEREEEAESRGVLKRKIPFYYIVMVNIYYIFSKSIGY